MCMYVTCRQNVTVVPVAQRARIGPVLLLPGPYYRLAASGLRGCQAKRGALLSGILGEAQKTAPLTGRYYSSNSKQERAATAVLAADCGAGCGR